VTGGLRGADPEALRGYAAWCEEVASAADDLAGVLRELVGQRCPIWGPFGEQLAEQLGTHDIAWLTYGAQRLRALAGTVRTNAEQQQGASADAGQDRPPAGGSAWDTVVGVLQLVGGGLEMVAGGALLLAPEPTTLTKIGGGTLVLHGADTVAAGWRTLTSGEAQETYTFQGAVAVAEWAGAPQDDARWVGAGVDIGVGLGPAVAARFTQRAAIASAGAASRAETLGPAIHVGYESTGSGIGAGHNVVGVTTKDGATRFFHLLPTRNGVWWGPHTKHTLPDVLEDGYRVATAPVTAAEADAALRRAVTLGRTVKGEPWSYLGPNCATTVEEVVEAGGQSIRHLGPLSPRGMFEIFRYPNATAGNAAIGASHIATPARAVAGAAEHD